MSTSQPKAAINPKLSEKLELVRSIMHKQGWDVFLCLQNDPNFSPNPTKRWRGACYLSGTTFADCSCVVTSDQALIFTDSRYVLQAKEELASSPFTLCYDEEYTEKDDAVKWIVKNCKGSGVTVVLDGECTNLETIQTLDKNSFNIFDFDILNVTWFDRPQDKEAKIVSVDNVLNSKGNRAYMSRKTKLEIVVKTLLRQSRTANGPFDAILLTRPSEIAYVFNLRNLNDEENLCFPSFAIITEKQALIFADKPKFSGKTLSELNAGVAKSNGEQFSILFMDIDKFYSQVAQLFPEKSVFVSDNTNFNLRTARAFKAASYYSAMPKWDVIRDTMASLNDDEAQAVEDAALLDGVAIVKAMYQVSEELKSGEVLREGRVSEIIDSKRSLNHDYISHSFAPIIATGKNAALPHYSIGDKPTSSSGKVLREGEALLIDSGAQYLFGTTDTTRVWWLWDSKTPVPLWLKTQYTNVLRAHLQLFRLVLPPLTTGADLDYLVRSKLYNLSGRDIPHGVGHGISQAGPVHAVLPRLSPYRQKSNLPLTKIKVGNLFSNEPGWYDEELGGVRLENMMIARKVGEGDELTLTPISPLPFDPALIDFSVLTEEERLKLSSYSDYVEEKLSGYLTEEENQFLSSKLRVK